MPRSVAPHDLLWALGSLCALHRLPFAAELVAREFPPPCTDATLISAARALKLRVRAIKLAPARVEQQVFPLLVALKQDSASTLQHERSREEALRQAQGERDEGASLALGIITAAADGQVVLFRAGSNTPQTLSIDEFTHIAGTQAWLAAPEAEALRDPDTAGANRQFGFRWFVPELLKHKPVWRDVLLASLALQLITLATPLFTQAIIDKVVVHRTQSTLVAIGVAMMIFAIFTSLLTWVRQYLVLHTGNRVDAVLGAAVFDHLLKLPLRYFQHRPTGVVAARLHGVENIREFVSGAAVSLVLDLPFLVICLGVMLWYSVPLTALAVSMLLIIGIASVLVAPVFQARLNEQFLLGARNQAFVTEHIGGFETVKSLQMEPQLRQRYAGYLATYLQSGFKTKQIGNTYNVFANTMEQVMTLAILMVGAYTVMTEPSFTIGMLVAFQMFAGKLSQPVLRIVGLWTNFQQAKLSVERLGDVMNAPIEPYSLTPTRQAAGAGRIEVQGLAFRYAEDRPLLYENLNLAIEPGKAIAIMGASGTGKSTLAKLMLGFYQPTAGQIRIDGVDIRHMAANELRAVFGVVPQETVLFSGTIYANLAAGNPAVTFEQVVQASKMAGVHDVIEALPQGYQSEVGERGAGLSGGQKQRLAIARALLKGPKVLIFDEATSALDSDTAEAFAKTVNQLKGKVTMLFITHAMPKALKIDEVVQLGKDGAQRLAVVPAADADKQRAARPQSPARTPIRTATQKLIIEPT
jgi:ATP-binding cassette, subfamily B, bacterial HlyB/CyaB